MAHFKYEYYLLPRTHPRDGPHTGETTTMAFNIKSLISNARQKIVGTAQGHAPIDNLFPKVDPKVDGEDCDHDCASCEVKLPKGWDIDESDTLYGFVKGWSTHVLVATGKTDWVRDVEDEKGSVMEAFGKSNVKPSNGVCFFSRRLIHSMGNTFAN